MKKSESELIEILLKNIINMHEKLNIIYESISIELNEEQYQRQFRSNDDKLVDIETDTYNQMCKMMGEGAIPFMGIA